MSRTTADLPDPVAVRRAFDRAASTYDGSAVLQEQVRNELLDRLTEVRLRPSRIVDLGAGTGIGTAALKALFRRARVVAVDFAPRMLEAAARRSRWRRRFRTECADAARLPMEDGSVDLIYSNLMLPWCPDPGAVFVEVRRVLAPGGLFTFSTLGPDTLRELHECWLGIDDKTHVMRFIDMHDIGDGLMRAGLAEPVMDTDRYTLTYDNVDALMRDLKMTGSTNATLGRPRGLTGRGHMATLTSRYERYRSSGSLPATCEVVFGHAWAPPQSAGRTQATGSVAEIPLDHIARRRKPTD